MNRRDWLKSALAASVALPPADLLKQDPELYWKRLRAEQFLLPEWRIFLNNGSLGATPKPVVAAVEEHLNKGAGFVTDEYPRWGYETLDAHRAEMAEFLGCKKNNLAFMHNATEAMSTIAAGIDLKAGDEVLITDQEHPSGRGPWYQRAARQGVTIREVKLPVPPKNQAELADVIISAIKPGTKVLSFSGILTTTGYILPVKQICEAARAKGVITVVDGAHMVGQVPVNLHEFGCDLFASSPHKWLFAPAGSGLLYLNDEWVDTLWATTVTGNWDQKSLKAARFMMVGTNNRAVLEGTMEGLRFHKKLGSEAIFHRIHTLAKQVRQHALNTSKVELLTPDDDRLYSALVTVGFRGKDPKALFQLCRQRKIWTMQSERLRISTHIHTRPSDVEAFFAALAETNL